MCGALKHCVVLRGAASCLRCLCLLVCSRSGNFHLGVELPHLEACVFESFKFSFLCLAIAILGFHTSLLSSLFERFLDTLCGCPRCLSLLPKSKCVWSHLIEARSLEVEGLKQYVNELNLCTSLAGSCQACVPCPFVSGHLNPAFVGADALLVKNASNICTGIMCLSLQLLRLY